MRDRNGIIAASVVFAGAGWLAYLLDPQAWPGLAGPIIGTVVAIANVVLTRLRPDLKVGVVRRFQRWVVNPLVKGLLRLGLNPLGIVLLETRGRRSGRLRRNPVGIGSLRGNQVWFIAEHGDRAGYLRNLDANPRVRIQARVGLRRVWLTGHAFAVPTDDPIARQRAMCGWHPLRWLNAVTVRYLGGELLSVRIDLDQPNREARQRAVVDALAV